MGAVAENDVGRQMPPTAQATAAWAHRGILWGVAYRMTGTVQDADDVVSDTFLRLVERPPPDDERPLRPWLVAVALNLARDRLRARKRREYLGPWLPAPVPDARLADDEIANRESASWAWLCAAEALTPTQRAVLLAREVLELSAAETAATLGCSVGAVEVALHRARAALHHRGTSPTLADDAVLLAFLAALRLGAPAVAARLLHPDAVTVNDGGGVVNAARRPVRGAVKIVKFFLRLRRLYPEGAAASLVRCNGLLTLTAEHPVAEGRLPPRFTLAALVEGGRIRTLYSVLAPVKLAAVFGAGG